MKKILSLCLILVLVISLVACKGGSSEETTVEGGTDAGTPCVALISDVTEVSPGETVEVALHIKNSQYTACFDIYVYADEKLAFEKARTIEGDTGLILAANHLEDETGEYVAVRGMVASTCDVMDNVISRITYTVSQSAVSGDKIALNMQIPAYQLGVDESGNEVYSVTDSVIVNNLILTVK